MKLDDQALLSLLQRKEDDAAARVHGRMARDRSDAEGRYFRRPMGNEETGRSQIVTSDVQDTIQWILPSLLDIFTASDEAVVFEPAQEEDVQAAAQATDACNYVFYKQNNGFLTLYTAIHDALLKRNCAVMWHKKTERRRTTTPYKGVSEEQLAMILQDGGELESATQTQGPDGAMLIDCRVVKSEEKERIVVEAFPVEELLIDDGHNSPLLDDCAYVARIMPVTLSELRAMGYECEARDLRSSQGRAEAQRGQAGKSEDGRTADSDDDGSEDETLTSGHLRMEWVLADCDGDGIAERRYVVRLENKILANEECSHVQVATATPMIVPHQWEGMSIDDSVRDLQELHTTLLRQMLDSLYLANNPRTKVLTDANWNPLANIDDLLDSTIGGVIRQRDPNATQEVVTQWVGAQAFPMLEYVNGLRENRTGVTRYNQGLDANTLNKTATGINAIMTASQMRIKLIARVMAETLVKPIFAGILKLLTEGGMEPLALRLRGEFVQFDPNEWRDNYDMTVNVGLGTGNRDQQSARLMQIAQAQAMAAQSGMMGVMLTPRHIYNTHAEMVKLAGFKNVGDFWQEPAQDWQPPEPGPPPEVQREQMKLQADGQKFQAQAQLDQQSAQTQMGAARDIEQIKQQGNSDRELLKQQAETQREAMRLQVQNAPGEQQAAHYDAMGASVAQAMQTMAEAMQGVQMALAAMSAPKVARAVKLADGSYSMVSQAQE